MMRKQKAIALKSVEISRLLESNTEFVNAIPEMD